MPAPPSGRFVSAPRLDKGATWQTLAVHIQQLETARDSMDRELRRSRRDLRDTFALSILQALLQRPGQWDAGLVVREAYMVADLMLQARREEYAEREAKAPL